MTDVTTTTYTCYAIQPTSYHYRDGVKICDDIADCGHNHKSIETAERCMARISAKGSTTWLNAEIRDSEGTPLRDPDPFVRQPKMSDEQCEAWAAAHRAAYHAGTMPPWKIERIERIPGWNW